MKVFSTRVQHFLCEIDRDHQAGFGIWIFCFAYEFAIALGMLILGVFKCSHFVAVVVTRGAFLVRVN